MATLEVKKLRSQADLYDSLAAKAKASKDYAEAARQETLARDTEFQAKSAQLRLDTKDELAKAKNDLDLAAKAKKDAEKNIAAGVDVIESTKLKQDAEEVIKEKSKAVDLVNNAIKNIEEKNAADLATYKASLAKSQQADDKKVVAERLKTTKEEINVVKQYQATATNEAENQLKLLKGENDAKIYSFEEFVRRKKALLTEDFQNQEIYYNQEIALATKTGKKDLIAQYTEKLKQAKTTYETQVGTAETKGIIDNEAKQNIDAYNTNLNMIHERYQDILGIERDSNAITSAKLELIRQQLVLESTEKGEVGETARQKLIEFEILKEAQNLKSKMAIYDKETATAEKIHGDAISRINQLEQVGQVSSLSATMARTKANERLLEIRQKDVDLARQALDEARPEARPAAQDKYDIAKQKLESLKLVANETGAMIEQSLGNAFDGAFTGLINKSMTASQAFKAFTNSILADIAKIIAQELRSQLLSSILKPLAGAAMSGLGNLAGSSGLLGAGWSGASVTNISSNDSFIGPIRPSANGNVFSGAGISAHSGTIVSSPTVFPFAKGVGLMGEAGPEAILPLKRNAQGKLGVLVDNAGQSKSNLYNITVNVQSKEGENPEQFGQRAAAAMMRSIAKEEISNARRPGNTLNKSRFG
jgi:phage-related minor tail protein